MTISGPWALSKLAFDKLRLIIEYSSRICEWLQSHIRKHCPKKNGTILDMH